MLNVFKNKLSQIHKQSKEAKNFCVLSDLVFW